MGAGIGVESKQSLVMDCDIQASAGDAGEELAPPGCTMLQMICPLAASSARMVPSVNATYTRPLSTAGEETMLDIVPTCPRSPPRWRHRRRTPPAWDGSRRNRLCRSLPPASSSVKSPAEGIRREVPQFLTGGDIQRMSLPSALPVSAVYNLPSTTLAEAKQPPPTRSRHLTVRFPNGCGGEDCLVGIDSVVGWVEAELCPIPFRNRSRLPRPPLRRTMHIPGHGRRGAYW